jgi:tetratricopeptide (TPR) repeat protein
MMPAANPENVLHFTLGPELTPVVPIPPGRARQEIPLSHARDLLSLAPQAHDPEHPALAHFTCAASHIVAASYIQARAHLEQAIALWDSHVPHPITGLAGFDVGALSRVWLSWVLNGLGYLDQARTCSREALAQAQASGQPVMTGMVMVLSSLHLAVDRGDEGIVRLQTAALAQSVSERGLTFFHPWLAFYRGWLKARQGHASEGIALMREALDAWQADGSETGRPFQLTVLAEACRRQGEITQGLAAVSEGLALVERTGARYLEAELHRLRGALLVGAGDAAEKCFLQAIAMARANGLKLWELRAATCLSRLWQSQGRLAEAAQSLRAVYAWFTEGFDSPDLLEARALLTSLEHTAHAESLGSA